MKVAIPTRPSAAAGVAPPLALALALVVPVPGNAQQCGPAAGGVVATAGAALARHAVAGGTGATEVGVDLDARLAGVAIGVGYRRVLPETGRADPDVVALRVGVPLARVGPISLCATGHAGVSHASADPDRATVLAGGAGLRLERPLELALAHLLPFLELRGLAGSLTGTAVGMELSDSGFATGGAAGVAARAGGLVVEAALEAHGFAGGLGVTPFPERRLRLGLGLRF